MLDLFCYTGGFSLNALKHGGAAHALGFDSSAPAIEAARRNAVANGLTAARFEVVRRLRGPRPPASVRREIRPGHLRPAQVRPPPEGRRGRPQGVPAAEPRRPGRAGARRRARHLLVLGPRRSRPLRRHARPGRRALRPPDPAPRTARAGAGPSRLGLVPGDGVFEVLRLPGGVTSRRKVEGKEARHDAAPPRTAWPSPPPWPSCWRGLPRVARSAARCSARRTWSTSQASFREFKGADYEPANRLLMDPVLQFQPWLEFNRAMLRRGRLPLWNGLAGCGAPHLANGQSAVFDPFHLIAYLGRLPEALRLDGRRAALGRGDRDVPAGERPGGSGPGGDGSPGWPSRSAGS